MFRKCPLSQTVAAKLFSQEKSDFSRRPTQMTLLKAILAAVLALGAFTTVFNSFGIPTDPPPTCFPCSK
jgi:hypothetical protein